MGETDMDKWFTNGVEWIQCDRDDFVDCISSLCVGGNYNYDRNGELSKNFYRATEDEIKKHFK